MEEAMQMKKSERDAAVRRLRTSTTFTDDGWWITTCSTRGYRGVCGQGRTEEGSRRNFTAAAHDAVRLYAQLPIGRSR